MTTTTLCTVKGLPLLRSHILQIVRGKLGKDFPESDPFIETLARALDKSQEPVEFKKEDVVFTVSCGCIITT